MGDVDPPTGGVAVDADGKPMRGPIAAPPADDQEAAPVTLERPDVPKKVRITERQAIGILSCCGIVGLGAFVGLIVLLNSIHVLGPEDQVLVEALDGNYVRNGPATVVLAPERKKIFRHPMRLTVREYAEVKHSRTGMIRHHPGPGLLFLGAYEYVDEVKKATLLQRDQYMRLVDMMTGNERVERGPQALIPEPLETAPDGVQQAVVLGLDLSVLIRLKSTGMLELVKASNGGDSSGFYIPRPYEEIVEIRNATVLTPRQYAIVKSYIDASVRHVSGPTLYFTGAYDELIGLKDKMILRKDEYIRLRNKKDGSERVVRGPQTFIPEPLEETLEGRQRATFLDLDTSALVLNRATGQQHLVTQRGVFMPSPYQQILEKRELIRVLPHEAMVVRNDQGDISILGGNGTSISFFLQPYYKVLKMKWSAFSEDLSAGVEQQSSKMMVTKIDTRSQKLFFRYSVFTSDNVKLVLDGTIFWNIGNVAKMINQTSDPSGDVWHHARSGLIQAVSRSTLGNFMLSMSSISLEASESQRRDTFYTNRGIEVDSIEITAFEVADSTTSQILQDIILETTERINRLQKQTSSDEIAAARLIGDIKLERKRTQLVIYRATNELLRAEMAGDIEGLRRLGFANTFIGGLNVSVPSLDTRIDLFKHYQLVQSRNEMTNDLGAGGQQFFVTPLELGLSLKPEL